MISNVYICEHDSLIHCFTATKRYLFFVSSSLANTHKVSLFYLNHERNQGAIKSEYPIKVSRTSSKVGDTNYVVRALQIVSVPLIKKNAPLETKFFLVINTGDGIQICSLENIVANNKVEEVNKWSHSRRQDFIHCSYSQGHKDGSIVTTYSTVSGSIVQFVFDVISNSFHELKITNELLGCQERIMDRINNISGLRNFAINCTAPSEEKLWITLSHKEGMAFSCFDNSFYAIVDKKLEFQNFYNTNAENAAEENVLTWVDFAIVKQYSSSSLRFYVVNITNLGCALYKRSNRGHWDMVKLLPRDFDQEEKASCVDCMIQLNPASPNQLSIFSGSENGKLYQWDYNFRDDLILNSKAFDTGDLGVVHALDMVGFKKLFFLNKNNTAIHYLQL